MLGGLLVLVITGLASFLIVDRLKAKYQFVNASLLKYLFFYHCFLFFAYYLYATFNSSDSSYYYQKVLYNYRGENWSDFYGTSTIFIEFVGYPFIKYLNFSYEAIMALFSFFGYLGFVYFYIFFRENIRFKHTFLGYDLLTLVFFLPNLHFWSSSFGKGALIFFGIGLFFFGISNVTRRYLAIIIGGIIIYYVRPHVMLVILVSSAVAFVFSTKGITLTWRMLFLACATVAFFFIYRDVLKMVGINESEFIEEGLDLTHRARELQKANSGVDIGSYSLPMQVFTFLYRPLLVDASGYLAIIVSFENIFYLLISLRMVNLSGIRFLFTGGFLAKTALISFLTISVALAQVSGNLGLAMRQKSQVMILLLFVVLLFLDSKKMAVYRYNMIRRLRSERLKARQPGAA